MVQAGLLTAMQSAQQMGKLREQLFKQMMGSEGPSKMDTGYVEFGSQAAAGFRPSSVWRICSRNGTTSRRSSGTSRWTRARTPTSCLTAFSTARAPTQ